MNRFEIRKISTSDWLKYKAIRLESLKDTPDAFGSSYEREVTFTPDQWISRLTLTPDCHAALALSAIVDGKYVGLVSGVIRDSDRACAHLHQMWVAQPYRTMGIGTALVKSIISWATEQNAEKLLLSATTSNSEAVSLYQKLGFIKAGPLELLREGSELQSQPMECDLGSSEA